MILAVFKGEAGGAVFDVVSNPGGAREIRFVYEPQRHVEVWTGEPAGTPLFIEPDEIARIRLFLGK